MAKRPMSRNSKKASKPQRQVSTTRNRRALDPAGAAYARLLSDPCNAPLCHPVYSGGEGGYLLRAESIITTSSGAGETAGYFHWTPGAVSANSSSQILAAVTASGATAAAAGAGYGTSNPGYAFLTTNASAIRCVAACLKISYPGAESARSGRIHFGQTSGGLISVLGVPIPPDDVAPLLPHFSRTPAQEVELVWKPNDADQLFMNPDSTVIQPTTTKDSRASLTAAWAGLPANVGLTFRLTAIYEWQPDLNRGLSVPNLSKSMSSNTLDEVTNFLVQRGFTFVRGMGMAAASGLIAGVSNAFGVMGAGYTTSNFRNRLT